MTEPASPKTPLRFACILAMPRSGSTHVLTLLKSCQDLKIVPEPFHNTLEKGFKPGEKKAFSRLFGDDALEENGEVSKKWVMQHVLETLEALHQNGAPKPLVFKLFRGHLKEKQLDTFFTAKDIGYVVLRRRPIECFISTLKARSLGKYQSQDTTQMRPTLDADAFMEWCEKTRPWYEMQAQLLEKEPERTIDLGYERHVSAMTSDELLSYLLKRLAEIGLPPVAPPQLLKEKQRQDREPDFRKRVANWDEFEKDMRAIPLRSATLDWAQIIPSKG